MIWLVALGVLLIALLPCLWVGARSGMAGRVIALQLAGIATVLALMALAEALRRPALLDVPLTLALLSWPSGLIYAHFYGRDE